MIGERWYTKADVVKDLTQATGRRVRTIDNSVFVVGERPPPPRICSDEDHEIQLRFGDSVADKVTNGEVITPDLKGITKMIRMVQNYDETSDDGNVKICTTRPKSPYYDIISISKLNPNVKEFIPKGASLSPSVHGKDETVNFISRNSVKCISPTLHDKIKDVSEKKETGHKTDSNIVDVEMKDVAFNFNGIANAFDVSNLKPNEVKNIATELKNKITRSSTSKANTFQLKKARNVAIANLQKLLSIPLSENNSKAVKHADKPLTLITPEYFETFKATDVELKSEIPDKTETISNQNSLTLNCEQSLTPEKYCSYAISPTTYIKPEKPIPNTIKYLGMHNKNTMLNAKDDKLIEKSCSSSPEIKYTLTVNTEQSAVKLNTSDPQIQDSIKKVNSWLNKTDKPKTPPVFLAPIAFKRKDTTNSQSPNGSVDKKIAKPTCGATEQYKPSEYANELMKTYMERANNIEKQKEKITWDNLDIILKEKDGQIRAKTSDRSIDSSINEINVSDNNLDNTQQK